MIRTLTAIGLPIVVLVFHCPSFAAAGFAFPQFTDLASDKVTIVLGEIHDVRPVEQPQEEGQTKKGYRFQLKVVEVLRPGEMDRNARELTIPFEPLENWEESPPKDGVKVMAHLSKSGTGWRPFGLWGFEQLKAFDEPSIARRRKYFDLWNIREPAEKLRQVLANAYGADPELQGHCLDLLDDPEGTWTQVKLAPTLSRPMGLSHLWAIYTAPNQKKIIADHCEGLLQRRLLKWGWEPSPLRYNAHYDSLRQDIKEGREIHHNVVDARVLKLCAYPEHGRENFELLLSIINGPIKIYRSGATIHLSAVYQPHTSDPKAQQLNRDILDTLTGFQSHSDNIISDSAAIALGYIAENYARTGPLPPDLEKLVSGKSELPLRDLPRQRLSYAWQQIEKMPRLSTPPDTHVLSYPWDNLLDKQVQAAGETSNYGGKYGDSVLVNGQRVWLDVRDGSDLPSNNHTPVFVRGKLTKRYDLPVFRYRKGEPFGEGLPVAAGEDLHNASVRYVLTGAKWELRKKK
ncbi:MAG: hypothetical protein K8T91_15140 [Planctomycetes bacterium]|nr:hypothetical protein [Planctomycetota bacterium]